MEVLSVTSESQQSQQQQPQQTLDKKQFVERTFYWYDHRSTYRVFTITYLYDRANKVLSYGASVYRDEGEPRRAFDKKKHRETALGRLNKRPVIVPNVEDSSSLSEFHEKIRSFIYKKGVKGVRL